MHNFINATAKYVNIVYKFIFRPKNTGVEFPKECFFVLFFCLCIYEHRIGKSFAACITKFS